METEIDGNFTLAELESALLRKEAAANELTALSNNGDDNNPLTVATFKKLGPGELLKTFHLILSDGGQPATTNLVCSGTVFVKGKETDVSAFRDN